MIEELCDRLEEAAGLSMSTASVHRSLSRFVGRRAVALGLEGASDYVDQLSERPAELHRVVHALMNNDSAFFTDLRLVRAFTSALRGRERPVRVWDAGCGTGARTYTLGIAAAEARCVVEIVGTDVDPTAVDIARSGIFGAWEVRELGPELRQRYFERRGGEYIARPDLQAAVRFEAGNLIGAGPPTPPEQFDVVVCSGVLPAFGIEAAEDVAFSLKSALAPGGVALFDNGSHALPALDGPTHRGNVSQRIASELRDTDRPHRPFDTSSRTRAQLEVGALERALDEVRRQVRSGQLDEARVRLEKLARAADRGDGRDDTGEPIAHRLWVALGNVHAASGALTHAMRCYVIGRRINPVSAETVVLMAAAQWRLGHPTEARRLLTKARFLDSMAWPTLSLASQIGGGSHDRRAQLATAAADAMRAFPDPFETVGWWAALAPVLDAEGSGAVAPA